MAITQKGGSGFLISRESLKLLIESMRKDPKFCVMIKGRWEDQEISNCFRKINVYPGEARDELGRERFFMDQFHELWEKPTQDFLDYSVNPVKLVCLELNSKIIFILILKIHLKIY
jgi:hypothetical protein